MDDNQSDIIIGIDLGTTNSCVAIWRNKNLEIIPDMYGNRTIPSVVAFTPKAKYVGREAKKQIELNPLNTFYEVKRLIGRKIDDESVQNDMEFITYMTHSDNSSNHDSNIFLESDIEYNGKKRYTPEEISAFILIELKHMAEDYLKVDNITKAIITVPAYFNDSQRQATQDAARIAGLECLRIINEPTAAAIAYGLEKASISKESKDLNIIVYDIGGGTLDVSLLNISDGLFQVLGSAGNTHLGGADFDNRLMRYVMSEFESKHNIILDDISSISIQRLKQACEEAKKRLSDTDKTIIAITDFYQDKNLFMTLTREKFENICRDLLIMCLKPLDDILKSCDIEKSDIDEIIMVGGLSRMPSIRSNIKLFFDGKEPNLTINPDEVVAAGAAIQAYILSNKSDPFSENFVLVDIIPLSLGVEVIGGVMNVIIPRNSIIPIKKKRRYTTDTDFDTSVKVRVYEGERQLTKDNFLVGEFEFSNLESAPRGVAQIDITFQIDVNGIISVNATDPKNSLNNKTINISSNKGRLSEDRIKELILEAQHLELKDKVEKQQRQLFYEIQDLSSNIKINISNAEFKLSDKDKDSITAAVLKIDNWLDEKYFTERTEKEYLKILNKIKENYGTLILKASNDNLNVKGVSGSGGSSSSNSTSVFDIDENDESSINIYKDILDEELGINNLDEESRKEIKRLRELLMNLCYTIFEIISSDELQLEDSHKKELKEYVDDQLLWIYIKEKITIQEYKDKIDEINNICNEIVEKYQNKEIFVNNTDNSNYYLIKKNELENLCNTLYNSINNNVLALDEDKICLIKSKVEENLLFIKNIDSIQDNTDIDCNIFVNKINDINELCNELYNSLINVTCRGANLDVTCPDANLDVKSGTLLSDLRK